jgi:hypothetical protein
MANFAKHEELGSPPARHTQRQADQSTAQMGIAAGCIGARVQKIQGQIRIFSRHAAESRN